MTFQFRRIKTTKYGRFILLLVPLLLGAACDPLAPGATGKLVASPGASFEDEATLEIRLLPDAGEPFDPDSADFSEMNRQRQMSLSLAEVEFPFEYVVGGGLGSSEYEHWRVVAWISKSDDVDRPKSGELYGTRVFNAEDCGLMISGYCGLGYDIDIEVDSLRVGGALQRVESEPGPGEYIEESFGNFTMRCKEGDDSARSIGTFIVTIESTAGRPITEVQGVRDGTIQDCWMTDINEDETAEVLLFTKSAGSGGYGDIQVYRFDGTGLQAVDLPEPESDVMDGYQGRDEYGIKDGRLERRFPLYLPDGANCCPEGGIRILEFDGAKNSWKVTGVDAPQ
jgi:hypothetical protein